MNRISHIIRLPIPAALALKLIHDARIAIRSAAKSPRNRQSG